MRSLLLAAPRPILHHLRDAARGCVSDERCEIAARERVGEALRAATSPIAAALVVNPPSSWSPARLHRLLRAHTGDAILGIAFVQTTATPGPATAAAVARWMTWATSDPGAGREHDRAPLPDRLELRLDDTLDAPSRARRALREPLAAWGLEHLADRAALVVSELVTNAVLYGGGAPVGLCIAHPAGEVLRVAVTDAAPDRLPVVRRPGPGSPAGRGLRIVDRSSDVWGITVGGTCKRTWCEMWSG